MNYLFVDKNPLMIEAWKIAFDSFKNVQILEGDITTIKCDALVSPANSFGFMDGGVDYAISVRLGWDFHRRLQKEIQALPEGELLVGKSLTLKTGDAHIPYLISAPTMRVPMSFNIATSVNAYLAMKAALIAAKNHPSINSIGIPGFCTGVGRMSPSVSANQMLQAFCEIELGQKTTINNFVDAQKAHFKINPQGKIYD
ncbi:MULTISPECIES: macro domain-containing protein [unclassified Aureispira]|uniref:macro domain-containing protein n=1 Tax=unclassified Aureispira TaxID=2649989 RepID=UPI0006970B5B|nr:MULTISPECIES: macro domain-containing protein [unclassified Aureispira]WMX12239.1 macro domain-containing protein [Aureispira sp. CCB-E]